MPRAIGETNSLSRAGIGAGVGTIAEYVIKCLGHESDIQPISRRNDPEVRDKWGKGIELDRQIKLSVWSGRNNIALKEVEFAGTNQDANC